MNDNKTSSSFLFRFFKSFVYAFKGIRIFFSTQRNAWVHFLAAAFVIILGFVFNVNSVEWCLLIFAIGFVFTAEIFNTAIEFLTDFVSPGNNDKIGQIKDLAAGGVLVSAIVSAIIGLIVFVSKFIIYFSH